MSRTWIVAVYPNQQFASTAGNAARSRTVNFGGVVEEDEGFIPLLWHERQEGKMLIGEPGGAAIGILTKDGQPKFFE